METKILDCGGASIEEAARIIREGGVVAFPTETVYGLGANALDARAVSKIFEAKGRPSDNPLIVHLSAPADIPVVARSVSGDAGKLIKAFMPGALTLVLKKQPIVPDIVTGGLDTVAVRVPLEPIARELINKCGCPLAAPSANLSGRPSPTEANHVLYDLGGRIPCIINGGGRTLIGLESTVADCTGERVRILRPGGVAKRDIDAVLGYESETAERGVGGEVLSPGTKYKHYSPDCEVILFPADGGEAERIRNKYTEIAGKGGNPVVFCFFANAAKYEGLDVRIMGADINGAQRNIFALFRECENYSVILAEGTDFTGEGDALYNRLIKASGGKLG